MKKEEQITFRLSKKDKEWLEKLGHGIAAEGIRRCMEFRHICHIHDMEIGELYEAIIRYKDNVDKFNIQ